MGGHATFAGTNYQAAVVAYIYCFQLAQRRLDWLSPADDTPLAVSGETGGPGDDVRVEITGAAPFELQAKAGLTGDAHVSAAIEGIFARDPESAERVALVVDRRSSGWIYRELATDFERVRRGRLDVFDRAGELYAQYGDRLGAIYPRALDVLPPDDLDAARARELLATRLVNPADAAKAWALLYADATDLCQQRYRRDSAGLVALLAREQVEIRPPSADEYWLAELEWTGRLLDRRHAAAAFSSLEALKGRLADSAVGAEVRYRLEANTSRALLQLRRPADAMLAAKAALDITPEGATALAAAARAAWQTGDMDDARRFAAAAIAADPTDERVWATEAQVASAAGEVPVTPPAPIRTSTAYRLALAEVAADAGDFGTVMTITADILAVGDRRPEALFLRAWATHVLNEGHPSGAAEVERLASEAISGLDDVHPLKPMALVLRATIYRARENTAAAEADLGLARSLAPENPDAVRTLVAVRFEAGDDDGALELLYGPVAADDALLVGIRAQVLTRRGRREEAAADVQRALELLPGSPAPEAARIAIAEAAVDLAMPEPAERALAGLGDAPAVAGIATLLRGRVAFLQDRVDDAVRHFNDAAQALGPTDTGRIKAELAERLARTGRFAEAVTAFDDIPREEMPAAAIPTYAAALFRVHRLVDAQRQIELAAADGQVTPRLLGVAVDIALAREDPDTAIAHLRELVSRGHGSASVRVTLAQLLIEAGRREDAAPHVAELEADDALSAVERMQLAELLRELGRGGDAIRAAFSAFLAARDDPRMHRALVGMVFASRIEIDPATEVAPDTFVRLRGEHDEVRTYVVLSAPPFHPGSNEISVEDAEAVGILRKSVGDTLVDHAGTWQEMTWTVEEILPAVVHFARDAMSNYQQRFPLEPWFATAIHVGTGDQPADYVRVIQVLTERRSAVDSAVTLLRDRQMPLGLVARAIGAPIAELMGAISAAPDQFGPLWTDWDDAGLQDWAGEQARTADSLVLTESGLRTMLWLGIEDEVRQQYDLVAPRALLEALRTEESLAREEERHGRSTVASGAVPIEVDDIPAGDPRLRERTERVERAIGWLTANVRVEPRPLETVQADDIDPGSMRSLIGKASHDAVALAHHLDIPMYADDLGLRNVGFRENGRAKSVSTASLISALTDLGVIPVASRDEHQTKLLLANYREVGTSVGILASALRRNPSMQASELSKLFAPLGAMSITPRDAARTAALTMQSLALDPVRLVPFDRVSSLALEAISRRVPRRVAAVLLAREASDTLRFLPIDLDRVREACAAFASG